MYRMPAEWEPHQGTWIAWPHNTEHWPGKFSALPPVFGKLVRELLIAREKVCIIVRDQAMEQEALSHIRRKDEGIIFFYFPTNSSWTRDFGPIFVKDEKNQLHVLDWKFNMWGEKYPPWELDDAIPRRVAEKLGMPFNSIDMVFEGGSIDCNGSGTLLTTEQCLLNKNRNPDLSKTQIEKNLREYLGATNVIWLAKGIAGDDTDGHIDDIARFVNQDTIVCQVEDNKDDENFEALQNNFEQLKRERDENGKHFTVVPLPMPVPVFTLGQRLPASYANFYIANTAVLMPTFQCAQDARALAILQSLFPARHIIGMDAIDFVWGLGTIHCSTQQQPR